MRDEKTLFEHGMPLFLESDDLRKYQAKFSRHANGLEKDLLGTFGRCLTEEDLAAVKTTIKVLRGIKKQAEHAKEKKARAEETARKKREQEAKEWFAKKRLKYFPDSDNVEACLIELRTMYAFDETKFGHSYEPLSIKNGSFVEFCRDVRWTVMRDALDSVLAGYFDPLIFESRTEQEYDQYRLKHQSRIAEARKQERNKELEQKALDEAISNASNVSRLKSRKQ